MGDHIKGRFTEDEWADQCEETLATLDGLSDRQKLAVLVANLSIIIGDNSKLRSDTWDFIWRMLKIGAVMAGRSHGETG